MPAYRHRKQHSLHTLRYGVRHFYRHHISKAGHTHQRTPPVPKASRKKRIWIASGLFVGLILLALVFLGVSAYRSVSSAKNKMTSARVLIAQDLANKRIFLSSAGRAQLAENIETVDGEVASASATLHSSVGLKVLGALPYLGDQRDGIENLVQDAGTTADTASVLLQKVNALVAQSSGTTVSLSALQSLEQSVVSARSTMAKIDRPVGDLLGPLGTARQDFNQQVGKISVDLARGDETLGYALPFLGADGPRTYLIAGENNAEMRDQGDVLSVGELTAQGGTYTMSNTQSVDNIEPTTPVPVPIPPGTQEVFGGYQPTLLWQSVNATADFPFSGQVMQAMFQQVQGAHVNGVIALDVPTLQSILALTGPVTVPNITGSISASNVAEVLLHQEYTQYSLSLSAQRHDNISAVAKAAFDKMKTEHVDLAALANALATDVAGRHLIVWDEVPKYESTVSALGASGSIDTNQANRTFHVAVENSTATKLDYYVRSSSDAQVHITPNGDALVNTTVTVTNTTPAGLGPTFQTGPDGVNSFTPGQYVSRVFLWSPLGSVAPGSVSESGLELNQNQVSVLPQQSQSTSFTTVIHHAVVHGELNLRFIPQPRLYPPDLKIEISAPGWKLTGPSHIAQPLAKTTTYGWKLAR